MTGRRILCALAAAILLVLAAPADALAAENGLRELERGLPQEAREALGGGALDETLDVPSALQRLWDRAAGALGGILRSGLASAAGVLAAALLCSAAAPLAGNGERGIDAVNLAGAAAILTAGAGGIRSLMAEVTETVSELADFSALLLPVMASASAASGAPASAAARYSASALFLSALAALGKNVIMPLIWVLIAAGAGEAAFGGCAGAVKLIKTVVTRLLTLVALAFTIYLAATGLIASSADAAAVKLTKTAISTLLPVVGGMVSDAADAVASGVGVIRGAAGAVGVVSVLAVCLVPFLKLAVNAALFRAAAAVAQTAAGGKPAGLVEILGDACALALGLAGTHAAILMVGIVAAARAAGA